MNKKTTIKRIPILVIILIAGIYFLLTAVFISQIPYKIMNESQYECQQYCESVGFDYGFSENEIKFCQLGCVYDTHISIINLFGQDYYNEVYIK